ncbi:MAG: twin-arginine translocase TatA/TatE family subunit [Nitrososphaeria archaeon]|nr:twin-arginine translocase TatA/TatE family subunit [Nitrososphaeria archaeon]MDW8021340.1 twin-arginine translocase TatA/TatE family subunit [Nitrososphaerota archaeon]
MITGIEWIIVAIVLVVLLLWGPSQLPKIAKAFGEAKKEFQKASKEAEEITREMKESVRPITETVTAATDEVKKIDDKLLEIAKSLGISTEGKTRDQIADEILKMAKKS